MRYALLMCGQPRTMEFCFPSLKKHILDVYNPDVFVVSDEQEGRLRELFDPMRIDIKPQEFVTAEYQRLRLPYTTPENEKAIAKDMSIAWKVWRAAQMKREVEKEFGFTYDTVMVSRFDVKFVSVPDIGAAEEDVFYAPYIGGYHITPPDEPGIHWKGYSGHLCWMSSKTADRVAGMYFEGDDIYKMACDVDPVWGRNPEHVLKYFCDHNGIRAKFVEIKMMLIRGTSEEPLSFHHHSLTEYPEYL